MPPKSPLWEYFTSNKALYRGDKTHQNACCNSCIASYICACKAADQEAVLTNPLHEIREDSQLLCEGKWLKFSQTGLVTGSSSLYN